MTFRRLPRITAILVAVAFAPAAPGQVLNAPFDQSYSFVDLGAVPGVPTPYGGITFHPTDADVVLLGGNAANVSGKVHSIAVVRDAQNHITGFSGVAGAWADAPKIDGGLEYGPGNVLFFTRYKDNELGQIPFGQTGAAKIVPLTPLGVGSSVGAFRIVPPGFPGAGTVKFGSFNTGRWYSAKLQPDGAGTYDVVQVGPGIYIGGGPEGIVYPPAGSPLLVDFANVMVCEFSAGNIAVYQIDANGDPVPGTRQLFMSGLNGVEGAALDPVTGDFLFSTYGVSNRVIAVRGFAVPACAGSSQSYGSATSGSGGLTPSLTVVGTPCVGNALSGLSLQNGLGGASTMLLVGLAPLDTWLPEYAGTVYVQPHAVSVFPIGGTPGVPGTGTFSLSIPIPNDPGLAGKSFFLQAVSTDPGAAKGRSFTQGLRVTIG